MTNRENFFSLVRRRGYERIPADFLLCPSLENEFRRRTDGRIGYQDYFGLPFAYVEDIRTRPVEQKEYLAYYKVDFKPGTVIDRWGVAHEPGSEAAKHMTRMYHPLRDSLTAEDIHAYPYPDYEHGDGTHQSEQADAIRQADKISIGNLQCTIWEFSWYLRSMEELMTDMLMEDPRADAILDIITRKAVVRAESFAKAGVDILYLGDDIGTQRAPMMSVELYSRYLKPRLCRVIDAARSIKPDLIIYYHSCGFVTPFIPHLIEAGVDVLNPIQPECMDFAEIHAEYGDVLSFCGTIGTQSVMPFGSTEDVRREVFHNLDIAGPKGGLLVQPTHLLEPEVPFENIEAYVHACRDYTGG